MVKKASWFSLNLLARRGFLTLALTAPFAVGCGAPFDAIVPEDSLDIDASPIVHGTASRGSDPAVVAILIGDQGLCSGTLIAPDLVLTARHCVSMTAESVACPSRVRQIQADRDARDLRILAGDSLRSGTIVATGVAIVTEPSTSLCGNDAAVIVLDRALASPVPLRLGSSVVRVGTRLRAAGFGIGEAGVGAGEKRVREHVPVVAVESREFDVGEATCSGDSGGPAIDEATGTIVGIVSRGTQPCAGRGATNTYSRVDAHAGLVDRAVHHPSRALHTALPHSASSPPASAVGSSCTNADDCATSICVHDAVSAYCTRNCGTGDRCPSGFRCRASATDSVTHVCQRAQGQAP